MQRPEGWAGRLLQAAAFGLSPRVEIDFSGSCTADLQGADPARTEPALRQACAELTRLGLPARGGAGPTPFLAAYAAQQGDPVCLVRDRAAFLRDYNDARLPESEWRLKQERRAEERTTKIVAHLREENNRSLRQLAAIPMILQIMAILWKERDHLPKSRVDLYNSVLDYLLQFLKQAN